MKKNITVLSEGAWGTAIAQLLAANGHAVRLWCYDPLVAQDIQETGYNSRYLPNVRLSDKITPLTHINEALENSSIIFEAVPVAFLRSVLVQAAPYYNADQLWVVLSKGIENNSLLLPSQILDAVMLHKVNKVILTGPSFAAELAQQYVTAVLLASNNQDSLAVVQQLCSTDFFKMELSTDYIGAQLCAAFKNVIAVAVGCLDGAGYKDNTKALLITRGLEEMRRLVCWYNGDAQTVYGLSGVGDLALTSMGHISKNRQFGYLIGCGKTVEESIAAFGAPPEGINTIISFAQLTQKSDLQLPICSTLWKMLFQSAPATELIALLAQ